MRTISLLLGIELLLKYKNSPQFNRGIERLTISLKALIIYYFVAAACRKLLIKAIKKSSLKTESLSFYLLLPGLIPYLSAVLSLYLKKEDSILNQSIKSISSPTQLQTLAITLIRLVGLRHKDKHWIRLQGFLAFHARDMAANRHKPADLEQENISEGEGEGQEGENSSEIDSLEKLNPWEKLLSDKLRTSEDQLDVETYTTRDRLYQELIEFILKEGIKKFSRSVSLRLLLAYHQFFGISRTYTSVYLLREIESLERYSSPPQKFARERAVSLIENHIRHRQRINRKETEPDISLFTHFDRAYDQFVQHLSLLTTSAIQFWDELARASPDARRVMVLGPGLLRMDLEAKAKFEKLANFRIRELHLCNLFAGYLKRVIHDEEALTHVLDRIELLSTDLITEVAGAREKVKEQIDRKSQQALCVVEASGNKEDMGTILTLSSSVFTFFGHRDKDLVGESVERLMPHYTAERHNKFMSDFFRTEKGKIMDKRRRVFGLNKEGFLIECSLCLRILPVLGSGLRVIGIITRLDEQ